MNNNRKWYHFWKKKDKSDKYEISEMISDYREEINWDNQNQNNNDYWFPNNNNNNNI